MWALVVTASRDDAEVAADALWALGVRAVEERAVGDTASGGGSEVELWTHVGDSADAYERVRQALGGRWRVRREDVDATPAETWREFAVPIHVDGGLVIVPAWQQFASSVGEADPLVVTIEPGGAFGLGDHPTTLLSARALHRALVSDADADVEVLDVGCGTGLLAIVAALVTRRSVRAVDVATAAVEATIDNARRNGVVDLVVVDDTPLGEVDGRYDLVVANILAPTLIELAGDLRRVTSPTGRLIISGVLDGNHDHVLGALVPMRVERTETHDGWAAVTLRHP